MYEYIKCEFPSIKTRLTGMKMNCDLQDSLSLAVPKASKELLSIPSNPPGPQHPLSIGGRGYKPSRTFHNEDNLLGIIWTQ